MCAKIVKIISHLDIDDQLISLRLKDDRSVFLQQGSIDGACGPYCLFMGLLIVGALERETTENLHSIKRSTKLGRALKIMDELKVLVQDGTDANDLKKILDIGFKSKVEYTIQKKIKNLDLIKFISGELDKDFPVLTSVFWNEQHGHWMLAIGYEQDEDRVTKIFFLDPSSPLHNSQYWNATISIAPTYRKKFHHEWHNCEDSFVKFTDCIVLKPK